MNTEEVVKQLYQRCLSEVRSLTEDDPVSMCAAHHRGAIKASAVAMQLLLCGTPLAAAYQLDEWNTEKMRFYIISESADHTIRYLVDHSMHSASANRHVVWSTLPTRAHIYQSQYDANAAARNVHGTARIASVDFVIAAIFDRREILRDYSIHT